MASATVSATAAPTATSPTTSQQRQVERLRLDEDAADVEAMERALERWAGLQQRAVAVLDGCDRRLVGLESSILPIHSATQRLTRLHENVQLTLKQLDTVQTHFELASKEEPVIARATATRITATTLPELLAAVDRVRQALSFFANSRMRNVERAQAQLRSSLVKAMSTLDALFRKLLHDCAGNVQAAVGVDGNATASDITAVAVDRMTMTDYATLFKVEQETCVNVVAVAAYLVDLEMDTVLASMGSVLPPVSPWRAVGEARSAHLLALLQPFYSAARGMNVLSDKLSLANFTVYSKGSSPFLGYARTLLSHVYYEWQFLQLLFSNGANASSAAARTAKQQQHIQQKLGSTFESVLAVALDQFSECADGIVSRLRRPPGTTVIQTSSDFSAAFLVLDVLEKFVALLDPSASPPTLTMTTSSSSTSSTVSTQSKVAPWQEAMRNAGKRATCVTDHVHDMIAAVLKAFAEFLDDVRNNAAKLPDDGTVHEMSSSTLNHLRRICEYLDTTEALLHVTHSHDSWVYHSSHSEDKALLVSKVLSFARQVEHQRQKQRKTAAAVATLPSPSKRTLSRDNSAIERAQAIDPYADSVTRRFFMDVLAGLLFSLESKSKGFKKGFVVDKSSGKTVLACIFLLNNFHYILKTLRATPLLLAVVGSTAEAKVEQRMREEMDAYLQSWNTLLTPLIEPIISSVSGQPIDPIRDTLSKSERGAIKDKFRRKLWKRNFNEDAEETYRQQKTYAMTDVDLRSQVLRDVKHLVIPAYTRFLERYQKIPFTDHPDKYIKYDVAALEGMLGRLFDPASVKSSQ